MSLNSSTDTNKSTQTFITALVLNVAVAAIEVVAFVVLRPRFRKVYAPRTYLPPPHERANALPSGYLAWAPAIIKTPAKEIIAKNGLDAYVFVRFLFLMIEIFAPFMLVTWIILLPVDAAGSRGTNTGLEMFTFGNVGLSEQPRYAAHLLITWLLTFWVFYLLKREMSAFAVLRHDFLISKDHASLPRSKTVLVTGIPKEYQTQEGLSKFCSYMPGGGARRIWFARDLKKLPDLFDRRMKACNKLESAETKVLKLASKVIQKGKVQSPTEADQSGLSHYVPTKKRPTHKLGFLGLFGKKVDTIDWAREEIAETNRLIEEERSLLRGAGGKEAYPVESAAFIEFHTQSAAHVFAQTLSHHAPLRMSAKYVEVAQEDVVWENLSIKPYQARVRYILSWAMTLGLIILWAFPVAFVGLISNVSYLCSVAPWLRWLCSLPVPINGIIQGALPPIALAVLMLLLPIVLRLFARFEGIPLRSAIELSLMTRYFIFQVIHGFLIVTLASGLVASIPQITQNPGSAVTLLATKLPAASTFFLTFIVTTTLAGAAGALLQIVGLVIYYVKLILLGSTPRSVYNIKFGMNSIAWGTAFPAMTLLTVIGLTYSVIAPIVCGFTLVGFAFFWFVYKYLFLQVIDSPKEIETGGLFYPKALGHIFVGLYIEEICLCGLFFLAQDANGNQSAIPEGAIMVVLIVFTILWQLFLNSGYQPLYKFLPLSLAQRIEEVQGTPTIGSNQANQANQNEKLAQPRGSTEKTYPPRSSYEDRDGVEAGNKALPTNGHRDGATALDMRRDGSAEDTLPTAFDHPAMYEEQRIVWIPQDRHNLYKAEVDATRNAKVEASAEGAEMNEKGKVDIWRSPPGEDWDEAQEA